MSADEKNAETGKKEQVEHRTHSVRIRSIPVIFGIKSSLGMSGDWWSCV
jgi:hypothetical protein